MDSVNSEHPATAEPDPGTATQTNTVAAATGRFEGDPLSAFRPPLAAEQRPRFGISLPTSGPFSSPQTVLEVARHAARASYHDVWCNDFYDWPVEHIGRSPSGAVEAIRNQDPNYFEGLTTLGVLGGQVPDIGLAVHAITMPVRDVRLMAKQVSTLQSFTGRVTIAPAIGVQGSYNLMGVPMSERGRRLDDALEALATILGSEHPVGFHGRYTEFDNATLYPRPQDIGLWITGDSEAALRRVVRFGTGWFSTIGGIGHFPALLRQLGDMATGAGRDVNEIDRATDVYVCVADTDAEAQRLSEATLISRYKSLERGLELAAIGSPATVADRLRALVDLGFTYLELRFICWDAQSLVEMIDRMATEVVPQVCGRPLTPRPRSAAGWSNPERS
jgi:alkanesulfonate monooxygenase SsuD/methylene tetrahydromethanopterin reductase-like flavin-dependent oxidoreductase (luciferase family)